jgi:hypothetical protein
MNTAALSRRPSEAEVKETIERVAREIIEQTDLPTRVAMDMDSALWHTDDLRPSERDRLDALEGAAFDRIRDRMLAVLVEELTPPALQFASEHPEAPRP